MTRPKSTFALAACIAIIPFGAAADMQQMTIGYTAGNMGIGTGSMLTNVVNAAIEITDGDMQRLAGAEITALQVAVANTLSQQDNRIFITDQLDGTPLYEQKVDKLDYGWNEVKLDRPFAIDGRALYVGFSYVSSGEALSSDGYADNPHADWLKTYTPGNEGQASWTHLGGGAFNIKVVVAGTNLPQSDIAIDRHMIRSYVSTTEGTPMYLTLRNNAAATVESIGVAVRADGSLISDTTLTGLDIPSGELRMVGIGRLIMPRNNIFDLQVEVTEVNGQADERPADNIVEVPNVIARRDYTTRRVLMEHYSTMICSNCPRAHIAIDDALRFRTDVVHVVYHSGFGSDALTTPEAEAYTWLFNTSSTYAPAMALDRTNMSDFGANDGYGSTPGPVFLPNRFTVGGLLDQRLSSAALTTIEITPDYDPVSRRLTVTVGGHIPNGSPDRLYASDPRLTVMLTEDSIPGSQIGVDWPVDGPYMHDHVLRTVLTDTWGDQLQLSGPDWESRSYSAILPDSWNPDNMRVVAFISDHSNNRNELQVYNANEAPLTVPAGIECAAADLQGTIVITRNEVILPDSTVAAQIVSIDGAVVRRAQPGAATISLDGIQTGVYVVTATTDTTSITRKFIIRQ